MKDSQAEAEQYLKYLDGTAYKHINGLEYEFNDSDGPNPFRVIERIIITPYNMVVTMKTS